MIPKDVVIWAIGGMAVGYVGLGGFIVRLFMLTVDRLNRRVEYLENRDDKAMAAMAANISKLLDLVGDLVDVNRDIRTIIDLTYRGALALPARRREGEEAAPP
jgi:hypothetical protein